MAFASQQFDNFDQWVNHASSWLCSHPEYRNTEHHAQGAPKGWQGYHFTAICFDATGRLCRNGGDFQRARDDGSFPVRWIWPDQVPKMLLNLIDASQGTMVLRVRFEVNSEEFPWTNS